MPVAASCASTAATWCSRASCGPRCPTGAAAAAASWQATIRSRRIRSRGAFAAISYVSSMTVFDSKSACSIAMGASYFACLLSQSQVKVVGTKECFAAVPLCE